MRVPSHPKATEELEEAAWHYETCSPGLGDDFLDEFERTLSLIIGHPDRWRRIRGEVRKLNLHRFPYGIVYEIRAGQVYTLAVMHLHRRPFYWLDRVNDD